ncbi:hypothetical protein MSAN_01491200 [Mycena sanguinolenta]|uniref:MYND-type domain-containing protein n=1 Tax=Mycena sanguinolenta TaxID=230812 RepID=A0A8H6Y9L2_9AGAR|nr:hypothetical protein MSAN_01491200 [Mycena sanguinolenta]
MNGASSSKLKYQLRQCANCLKPESCNQDGERFKICSRCKITRYCDARCQKKDWPKHKRRCEMQSDLADDRDEGQIVTLPMQAVSPLLHEWLLQYRPLLCLSLLHAQGLWDHPPPAHYIFDPQVFYVKMSSAPGISTRTKARAAFRVDNAEVVPISEFRTAAITPGHRMYDRDLKVIVEDFDAHLADRVSAGQARNPNCRICMVVHSIYFHNGFAAMQFHKNWYFEDDRRTDYSQQWRPPTDDWLDFLKATVTAGKGWDRGDVRF